MSKRYIALLLAGRRQGKDPICTAFGVDYKSLVPVVGQPMILHPLLALASCPDIDEIVIAAQEPDLLRIVLDKYRLDGKIRFCSSADSIADTVLSVYKNCPDGTSLLVTTADNCLLDAAHLDDFLPRAMSEAADVVMGFSRMEALLAECPAASRTWIRFSDAALSGCNLFLLKNERAASAVRYWKTFESSPKKILGIARALGTGFFLRYWRHKLSVDEAFASLSQLIAADVRPLYMSSPEIAIDADKLIDIRQIETILKCRVRGLSGKSQLAAPRPLVIFDLDRTITTFGTYTPFLLYYASRHNLAALLFAPAVLAGMCAYLFRMMDRKQLKTLMFGLLAGRPTLTTLQKSCSLFVDRTLRGNVYSEALQSIRNWREQGAVLVLATASYDWMALIFARRLGFDHVIATESLQQDEKVIPGITGENCYGIHKHAKLVEQFGPIRALRSAGWQVWFYTDHHSDIHLLSQVDFPVAVNPTRRLKKWAEMTPAATIVNWRVTAAQLTSTGKVPTVAESRHT